MKNKKETLIETLHGSAEQLKLIPGQLDGISIYDDTGHVDCEFFTDCLVAVNQLMDASNLVVNALSELLGPCGLLDKPQKKSDEGSKWTVEEILKHCTLEDNVLKLPKVQFNKKSYAEAKKWIEEAGGSWTGGKVQGFTFPFNAKRVFGILHEGKRCNLQQEFQFFATPPSVADWLVSLAGGVSATDRVLEPSAGTGAIVDAIRRSCPGCEVDCFELMPENRELLVKKDGVNLIGDDFTKSDVSGYNLIIANPPFSNNQDVDHVLAMYDRLAPGGVVAAIMSQHWRIAQEKKCTDFRKFLDDVGASVHEIAAGEFSESGTGCIDNRRNYQKVMIPTTKHCPICGRDLPFEDFYLLEYRYSAYCKKCSREYRKKRYWKFKELASNIGKKYTPEEVAFIKRNYRKSGALAIARMLGRTEVSISNKAFTLGITKQQKVKVI